MGNCVGLGLLRPGPPSLAVDIAPPASSAEAIMLGPASAALLHSLPCHLCCMLESQFSSLFVLLTEAYARDSRQAMPTG